MARHESADSKRVTIGAKLSASEAAAVEAARGGLTRSAWVRLAVLAALAGPPEQRREVERPALARRQPEPRATPPAARRKGDCAHPNMRVGKGVCPDCHEWVSGKR